MSRSWHHGCGRGCPVCSPGGRGPDWHRQRATERAIDEATREELEALDDDGLYGDGLDAGPCGCADCIGRDVLDDEDAARLRAMGVLILLAPQEPCVRGRDRFEEPCETCGSYGLCFSDEPYPDTWSTYEDVA